MNKMCHDAMKKRLFSTLAWPPVCGEAVEEYAGPKGGEIINIVKVSGQLGDQDYTRMIQEIRDVHSVPNG